MRSLPHRPRVLGPRAGMRVIRPASDRQCPGDDAQEYRYARSPSLQAIDSRTFTRMALDLAVDEHGLVTDDAPEAYPDVTPGLAGETVFDSLTVHGTVPVAPAGQVFLFTLEVLGDPGILLGQVDVLVVVSATILCYSSGRSGVGSPCGRRTP